MQYDYVTPVETV